MTKVYFQYPWKFTDSSYYRNLLNYPPKGIDYVNKNKQTTIDSKTGFIINKFLKNQTRKIIKLIKIPNITYTKNEECEIIHCAHCLSLSKKPWIVDFEKYDTLTVGGEVARSKKGIKIIKKFLKSKYCKKIMPWTIAAKNSLIENIKDKEIISKIQILPFAVPERKFKTNKTNKDKINLLFIARYFEPKGGPVVLEVMDHLTKKYKEVHAIFVSQTPKSFLKKYSQNKKIKFCKTGLFYSL